MILNFIPCLVPTKKPQTQELAFVASNKISKLNHHLMILNI